MPRCSSSFHRPAPDPLGEIPGSSASTLLGMILGPKACSIPAWGNAPGLEIEELPRAAGPFLSVAPRPAVPQRDCPGLQPSIHCSHETQGDALGCYGIRPLALKMENRTESFPELVTRTRMGKRRGVSLPAALQRAGPSEIPVSFPAEGNHPSSRPPCGGLARFSGRRSATPGRSSRWHDPAANRAWVERDPCQGRWAPLHQATGLPPERRPGE